MYIYILVNINNNFRYLLRETSTRHRSAVNYGNMKCDYKAYNPQSTPSRYSSYIDLPFDDGEGIERSPFALASRKKKWEIYIFRTFLGQKVFFFILVAENKRRKNERKRNFIYIEINNHWKPSVWAHSNVIYDVIHHFYREKTFSCLSLPLSQSLWASSFCRLLSLSLAKDFLCRSSLMRTKPNQTKPKRTEPKPNPKQNPSQKQAPCPTYGWCLEEIREKVSAKRGRKFPRDPALMMQPPTSPCQPPQSTSHSGAPKPTLLPRLMLMKCMRMKYGKLQIALAKSKEW